MRKKRKTVEEIRREAFAAGWRRGKGIGYPPIDWSRFLTTNDVLEHDYKEWKRSGE